ncbi:hypothetical protein K438DRAFT_1960487 [Mycena galopus ATCC 62051]|nr:hypothetical protein K438DRAFT_1960487 [Mycena galopus ATCC 62051]
MSLDVFKVDLLAQIQSTITRSHSGPSYSTVVSSSSACPSPMHMLLAQPPSAVIKEKVISALAASGIPKLQDAELKGIKVLPCGWLLVAIHRREDREPPQADFVNSMPRSFKADGPHSAQELYAHNCVVISDPLVIKEVCWLNPKALRDPKKQASSLLLTLADIVSADRCIAQMLAVD